LSLPRPTLRRFPELPQATVLIIDDDPAMRNSLKFALEVEGFAVRAYPTGADLLADREETPEVGCLVIDYKLPEMNGLDLLFELRKRKIDLPAILITTHPNPAVRNRAAMAGVPLVEKPLLNDMLFQGIRAALDGAAPAH
jgi:two-component system, LuxR family, response regulator FixJ